jgi:hypothetical protein
MTWRQFESQATMGKGAPMFNVLRRMILKDRMTVD